MLEGLKAAATGMTAQQQRMDAVSNDIANVNTTGYRHERVAFADLVSSAPGAGAAQGIGAGAGVAVAGAGRATGQGALEGSNVDIADAMVDLMDAQRSFQMASQAVRTQDQMLSIANGLKQ